MKIGAIVKMEQYEIHKELNKRFNYGKKKRRGYTNEKQFFSYVAKHLEEKTNVE